jgi:hypothetical protein
VGPSRGTRPRRVLGRGYPTSAPLIVHGYATQWFTTPFLATSDIRSSLAIVVYRQKPRVRPRPLPPYGELESCPAQMLRWSPRG